MIRRYQGFTLIELIAVLIIIGIIGAAVSSRFFDDNSSSILAAKSDVISALRLAQQMAMDTDASITFVSTNTSISVERDGAPVAQGAAVYPLVLPSGASISPATTLNYNRLGETTATNFSLTLGATSASVDVSAAGYAN